MRAATFRRRLHALRALGQFGRGRSAASASISALPMTIDSGLFSSCATPASNEPNAAIFSLWCSASRWRWISASAARAAVRSRRCAVNSRRSGRRTSVIVELHREDFAIGAHRLDFDAPADDTRRSPVRR